MAATLQAYINDSETILTLIANGDLEESLEDLREMESVLIEVDPEKEALVPRPEPDEDVLAEADRVLQAAESRIFEQYREKSSGTLVEALSTAKPETDVTVSGESGGQLPASAGGESVGNSPGEAAIDANGTPVDSEGTTPLEISEPAGSGTDVEANRTEAEQSDEE